MIEGELDDGKRGDAVEEGVWFARDFWSSFNQNLMAGFFSRSSAKKQNIMLLNERSQTKRK